MGCRLPAPALPKNHKPGKQDDTHDHTVEVMDGVVRNFGRDKGLQLRLELGNVVTREGVRGRVVVGD